jgi:folate-binding protein YgfZ
MQTLWSKTVTELNVSLSEDIRTTDTWVSHLDYMGALTVIGQDASKFLQGQLSCDVNTISAEHSTPGSHCNPQGRMLSNFRLFSPAENHFVLAMQAELCETAQKALQKYIVFSKATLSRVDHLLALGLHGPDASNIVAGLFGKTTKARNDTVQSATGSAIQIDEMAQSFEIYLDPENTDAMQSILQAALLCDNAYWQQQCITNGLWYISADQSGEHIPLVAALDKIEGISFKKGCYTGQEIIARMHYRGKAKRHIVALETDGFVPVSMGDKIIDSVTDKDIGEVVAFARTKNLTSLLAVLNLSEDNEVPPLTLNNSNGPALR